MSAEQLCGLTKERGKPDGTPTVSTHLLQIQTILSVLELHQISMNMLADFTADREFHPALKTLSLFSCWMQYSRRRAACQYSPLKNTRLSYKFRKAAECRARALPLPYFDPILSPCGDRQG